MKEEITIYRSKKKAFYIILAGFILVGASFLSFAYGGDEVFGWIFLFSAALVFLLGASNLRDRKPQLVLNETGITDLYTIKEEIEWDAIVGVNDFFFRGTDFVRILVPSGYKAGSIRPTLFPRFNRVYESRGLKAVYIRVGGLEINSKQLTTIIGNMAGAAPSERNEYLRSVKGRL